MKPLIPIARPDLGPLEEDNVRFAMRSGWITQGKWVHDAERMLQEYTGRQYAICCSSGTMALFVVLLATRPKTVATPALTFAAVHNAVRLIGAKLHCLDADLLTWQPSEDSLRGRSFDAVIAAPCYGSVHIPQDSWTSARLLIEDASESFGGHVNGVPAGKNGRISIVSFYANKIVTAGEGGAILTDDEHLYKTCRLIINHGIADKSYAPIVLGLNGRMTDLQAAILCAQLSRMREMLARRHEILNYYWHASKDRWQSIGVAKGEVPAPWVFAGLKTGKSRWAETTEFARAMNVEWRPFFPIPNEAMPDCKNAHYLSVNGICLPLSSAMTDEEVERVTEVIRYE